MGKDFDFKQVPDGWALCYVAECDRKEACLRYQACRQAPVDVARYTCVLPTVLQSGKPCAHFHPIEKIRAAAGFKDLLATLRGKDFTPIRAKMVAYLGRGGTFYRYRNGKQLLMPEQQEWIINLLRRYGYTEEILFDKYIDMYRFTWG